MRILLIMNPGIPVPPKLYGGIERMVYLLAEEYIKKGHKVTLLAGPESYSSGNTVTFGKHIKVGPKDEYREIFFVWRFLRKNHSSFDLIHNFGRLVYLLPVLNNPVRKIMSYERPVSQRGIRWTTTMPNRNLIFTGCSNYCVSTGNVAGNWATVYNAVDFSQYQLNKNVSADAPLVFLGRIERIKGAHTAVRVAKETGSRLIIAGNIPPGAQAYFDSEIKPHVDNELIKYIGPVNDAEKNNLLRQSRALLFPIKWEEPFGIVMIEAMACGTPVVGFQRGSVPEVIDDGVTGFITNNGQEMSAAIARLDNIDRAGCRDHAFERFSAEKIANDYLALAQ
ncbi:MAG TPA: glycosyltransferase family 4 protein [Mucilaginibacter sp.]|nr:glycosyltransferase family 4 protein [Mucilaginibacter sp.]